MIRNYALTCAAITLRIYLPPSIVAGIPFRTHLSVIVLCWVPNLLYAQFKAGKLHEGLQRHRNAKVFRPCMSISASTRYVRAVFDPHNHALGLA